MNTRQWVLLCVFISWDLLGQNSLPGASKKSPLANDTLTAPGIVALESSGEPVATPEIAFGSFGPTRCQDSNVYLRPLAPDVTPLTAPLVRLASSGKSSTRFDLRKVPSLQDKQFVAPVNAIDNFGRVYFLTRLVDSANHPGEKTLLVRFSSSGEFSS